MDPMRALLLLAVPALPLLAAAAITLFRPTGDAAGRWAVRSTAVAAAAAVVLLVAVGTDDPVQAVVEYDDGTAMLGLHAGHVGAVLALLTTGVGLVVQSFAGRALAGDPRQRRFFALAALLTAATTGVATAVTATGLTLAWIVAGASLAALVGHRAGWAPATQAVRRTRRAFFVGDAALVVGALVAVGSIGEIDLRAPGAAVDALASAPGPIPGVDVSALAAVATMLAVAAVSRSALVPLHRWLPSTLAAPTPVSALLHAGVVNGGGVLLVRFAPVFGESALATHLAFVAGVATAVLATAVMLVRSDVKGNLAWSTAGQMGFMTMQLAVGAFSAALFHIVGHAMYKASLFLASGGAVLGHSRHRRRPASHRPVPGAAQTATVLVAPTVALIAAYAVLDPHLPTAGDLLVVVFAWATAARAVRGWVHAGPFRPVATVATATLGAVVGVFGYVGGLSAFEGFVAPALPADVSAAVGPALLAAVLAVVAVAVGVVWFAPGAAGEGLRRRVYAGLVSMAAPAPVSATGWWRRQTAATAAVTLGSRASDPSPHSTPTSAAEKTSS